LRGQFDKAFITLEPRLIKSTDTKSEPPKQHENDNDDQDGADDTDAAVAEAVTVPAELAAETAEQEDDEDDNEDGSERHDFSPEFLNSKGVADHSRMLLILCNAETRNRKYVSGLSSAGFPIGGAIAAVRAVARDFIGMIARVSGVTVRALHAAILDALVTAIRDSHITAIQNCHIVITAPEIRQAAITNNAHDIRGPGWSDEHRTPDDARFNRCGRECCNAEASGRGDYERELSCH
jgi:hypothetical protein